MNTAKHSKNLNLPQQRKKRCPSWINRYLPTLFFGSLIGTYLDLYFIGSGMYAFPIRPFPDIFTFNIAFTLIGLPIGIAVFLLICQYLIRKERFIFILLISLAISVFEKQAETYGYFIHSESWKHYYSFFGYSLYLAFMYQFFQWSNPYWHKK